MNAKRASDEIERRVVADGPPEPRVLHVEEEEEWSPVSLRMRSMHDLAVLGRGGDIVVFFDDEGRELGWRDDTCTGAAQPAWIDRDAFREAMIAQLDLPETTRLGKLEPAELPPVGWTHESVLFLAPVPAPSQVLRVWVDPANLRVIQCLRAAGAEVEE